MEPLDKLIKIMETCHGLACKDCPYEMVNHMCEYGGQDDIIEMAVTYLKEYKDLGEGLQKEIAYYRETSDSLLRTIRKLEEAANEDNPPLSWNDLLAIAGQPVWVECSEETHIKPFWGLVGRYTGHAIPFYTLAPIGEGCCIAYGHKFDIGINWTAYRKERI